MATCKLLLALLAGTLICSSCVAAKERQSHEKQEVEVQTGHFLRPSSQAGHRKAARSVTAKLHQHSADKQGVVDHSDHQQQQQQQQQDGILKNQDAIDQGKKKSEAASHQDHRHGSGALDAPGMALETSGWSSIGDLMPLSDLESAGISIGDRVGGNTLGWQQHQQNLGRTMRASIGYERAGLPLEERLRIAGAFEWAQQLQHEPRPEGGLLQSGFDQIGAAFADRSEHPGSRLVEQPSTLQDAVDMATDGGSFDSQLRFRRPRNAQRLFNSPEEILEGPSSSMGWQLHLDAGHPATGSV